MMATASMGIMRTVIAKPLRSFVPIGSPVSRLLSCRKEAPAALDRGQVARLFRPSCLGTNGRGVRRALQVSDPSDAPLPDAKNVTQSRKSCEVPSFPQDTLELIGTVIIRVPEGTARE
jgi:hypothetical protein